MHKPSEAVPLAKAGAAYHDYPSQLRRGTILPDFELFTQGSSKPVSLWDYKQKRNLVLAVLHASCPNCTAYAEMLRESEQLIASDNAAALVVVPVPIQQLPAASGTSKILLLADPEETIRTKLSIPSGEVAIFIADQWGEVYHAYVAADAGELPAAQAIHEWLTLIEIQCPECFPPER